MSLTNNDRLVIGMAQNVGSELIGPVPVEEEGEDLGEKLNPEGLLKAQEAHEVPLQIRTILGVLTGIDGTGGMVGALKTIENGMSELTKIYHDMDKKQALMEEKNEGAHEDIKKDIDGIGRKAQRAIELSECTQRNLESHIKEELKEDKEDLKDDKKTAADQRFQLWHGIVLATVTLVGGFLLGGAQ